MKADARLGRGWRFPVLPAGGDLAYDEGADKVRQAMWIVLDTEPGGVLRPDRTRPGLGLELKEQDLADYRVA